MKNKAMSESTLMIAMIGALLASQALGQAPASRVARTEVREAARVGQLDPKTTGTGVRVSQLIGMNIQNDRGESVGEINDIVLNSSTGSVEYVAVTYGGLFGLGDKLFAVPYEAMTAKRDANQRDTYVLVMNVTQQQLEGAKGFDQDHWPDVADDGFLDDMYKRYKVQRRRPLLRNDSDVDVQINRNGIDVDVDRDRSE